MLRRECIFRQAARMCVCVRQAKTKQNRNQNGQNRMPWILYDHAHWKFENEQREWDEMKAEKKWWKRPRPIHMRDAPNASYCIIIHRIHFDVLINVLRRWLQFWGSSSRLPCALNWNELDDNVLMLTGRHREGERLPTNRHRRNSLFRVADGIRRFLANRFGITWLFGIVCSFATFEFGFSESRFIIAHFITPEYHSNATWPSLWNQMKRKQFSSNWYRIVWLWTERIFRAMKPIVCDSSCFRRRSRCGDDGLNRW